jgi:cytochrome P450
VSWLRVFEEYARWISPIGMTPRRIAKPWTIRGIAFEPEDRVFLMFSSANRDEHYFDRADKFDVGRDTSKSIAFGAGPHFCAGAFASRAMVADVALPTKSQDRARRTGADRRLGILRVAEFAADVGSNSQIANGEWKFPLRHCFAPSNEKPPAGHCRRFRRITCEFVFLLIPKSAAN